MRQDGAALQYASEDLKADRKVMLEAAVCRGVSCSRAYQSTKVGDEAGAGWLCTCRDCSPDS